MQTTEQFHLEILQSFCKTVSVWRRLFILGLATNGHLKTEQIQIYQPGGNFIPVSSVCKWPLRLARFSHVCQSQVTFQENPPKQIQVDKSVSSVIIPPAALSHFWYVCTFATYSLMLHIYKMRLSFYCHQNTPLQLWIDPIKALKYHFPHPHCIRFYFITHICQ